MVRLSLTLENGVNKRGMLCVRSAFLLSWRRQRRGGGGAVPFLPFSSSPQPGPRGRILSLTLFFFLLQPPITPRWMVHNSTQVNTPTNTRSLRVFAYQIEVVWRVGGGVASSFKRIVQVVSSHTGKGGSRIFVSGTSSAQLLGITSLYVMEKTSLFTSAGYNGTINAHTTRRVSLLLGFFVRTTSRRLNATKRTQSDVICLMLAKNTIPGYC